MAKAFSGKKPQHFGNTIRVFLSYLGRHKFMLGLVGAAYRCQRTRQPAGYLHDQAGGQRYSGNRQHFPALSAVLP